MGNNEFVTLAKFTSPDRARVVKAMLDSMGIDNQIIHDTAVSVMPMLTNAVYIVVNADNYDRAREVLEARFDKKEYDLEAKAKTVI